MKGISIRAYRRSLAAAALALASLACLNHVEAQNKTNENKAAGKQEANRPEAGKANRPRGEKPERAEVDRPAVDRPAGKGPTAKTQPQRAPAKLPSFTQEREAAALTFAGRHHPELVELLNHLSRHNRAEYEEAIRALFQVSEWLAGVEERDADRHLLELESWKLGSRINLLAARLTMEKSSQLEDELRTALQQQVDVRIQIMELERERLKTRLSKLEEQLQSAGDRREWEAERRFKLLLQNSAGGPSPSK